MPRAQASQLREPERAAPLPALLGALLISGCSGPAGAGRTLGDDLGTFSVAASETANSCGPGALGSSERFDFEVDLSRDHTELFWDGRVGGEINAALAFEFTANVRVELRAARSVDPGCAIARRDEVLGVLEEEPDGGIAGFSGSMLYAFEPEPDAACTPDELERSGLPDLPCRMEYVLAAERTRAPDL